MARETVREKLELEGIIELETEELEKLRLENHDKTKKLQKLELKKLKTIYILESKLNKLERLKIKGTVKEFHELANDSNINLRIESKKLILSIAEYINNGKKFKIKSLLIQVLKTNA